MNPMAVATTQCQKMEDQKPQQGNNNVVNGRLLETKGANIPLWLMKTPPRVSRCLKPDFSAAATTASASDQQQSSTPVAKVVFCLDKTKENEDGAKVEYRIWNHFCSKLAAAILGGVDNIWILSSVWRFRRKLKEQKPCPPSASGLQLDSPGLTGYLIVEVNGGLNQQRSANLKMKCYALDMSENSIPMSVFAESSQGTLSVEGYILDKLDMKPHNENLENYGKLCRERTKKSMKSRKIQVMNNDNGAHMRPRPGMMIGFVSPGPSEKKKMPTKGSDMKRTRKDREEMEDIMFNLFEQKPNRTLRQLIQETNQPEQFLKDILKDLCVYNNKGANQGTYELKLEYRKSVEEPLPIRLYDTDLIPFPGRYLS